MKFLQRTETTLKCLENFVGGRNNWNEVNKESVWASLDVMQKGFCAYCECSLKRKHIEHFRTRDSYTNLTFVWSNIFGSCGDSSQKGGWNRCGIYKDNGAGHYDIESLIKPDEDNPNDFFLFLTTGKVRPKDNLKDKDLVKAEESIRVFNLNDDSVLFNSRRRSIESEQNEIDMMYSLFDEFSEKEWKKLLDAELERVSQLEFSTALTHAWRYNCQY